MSRITDKALKRLLNTAVIGYGVSIALLIASFTLPPLGIIDKSVLEASSLIMAFGTTIAILESRKVVRISHGSTSLYIGDKGDEL